MSSQNPSQGLAVADSLPAIEPDEAGQHETDSAFNDGSESYTTSLAESVLDYKYENGRRYHAFRDGEYPLPNDEKEQDRLDLIHHMCMLMLGGKLYRAPIAKDQGLVLDVGTGTGIWAVEFAEWETVSRDNPSAEVIGTDLSPIQPRWLPPNLRFEVDDAESDWSFPSKFDFIHLRSMGGSIKDVPRLLRQAFDYLNPGGWLEWQEYETVAKSDDGTLRPDSATVKWQEDLNKAADKFGKVMNIAPTLKPMMGEAGFVNVSDQIRKVPLSPWAKDPKLKELGRYNQLAMLESLPSYTLRLFTNVLGWPVEKAEESVRAVKRELYDPRIHMYGTYHFLIGQKPKDA